MFPCVPPPRLASDELETLDPATEEKAAAIVLPAPVSAKKQRALRSVPSPEVGVAPYRQSHMRRQKHCQEGHDLSQLQWVLLVFNHFLSLGFLFLASKLRPH